MKSFSLFRAAAVCAVLALLFPFASCSSSDDEEIHYDVYPVELSADDHPVSGVYSTKAYSDYGTETAFIFRPSIAYATACSCAVLESADGKTEGSDYVKISGYGKDTYFNLQDSEKVYVVYNLLSDADVSDGISEDELDNHSGVIIFKAKHSPYGTPKAGCFYGVKFQFLTENGQLPSKANKDFIFSKTKVYIESGYNPNYNNVSSLEEAVEKFGFNNSDYFSASNWTSSASGADKTGRAAAHVLSCAGAVFTKTE